MFLLEIHFYYHEEILKVNKKRKITCNLIVVVDLASRVQLFGTP